MMARIELTNRKNGRERISMNLFLPVHTAKEVQFDPECIDGHWPPVLAHWEGTQAFGQVVWDESDRALIIHWTDDDETETLIPLLMDLHKDRVLSFKSVKLKKVHSLYIDEVEVL